MRGKNFLKVYKSTGGKMFAKYLFADGCFIKRIILLTVMITMMKRNEILCESCCSRYGPTLPGEKQETTIRD